MQGSLSVNEKRGGEVERERETQRVRRVERRTRGGAGADHHGPSTSRSAQAVEQVAVSVLRRFQRGAERRVPHTERRVNRVVAGGRDDSDSPLLSRAECAGDALDTVALVQLQRGGAVPGGEQAQVAARFLRRQDLCCVSTEAMYLPCSNQQHLSQPPPQLLQRCRDSRTATRSCSIILKQSLSAGCAPPRLRSSEKKRWELRLWRGTP